jgi:hypothetical protein
MPASHNATISRLAASKPFRTLFIFGLKVVSLPTRTGALGHIALTGATAPSSGLATQISTSAPASASLRNAST